MNYIKPILTAIAIILLICLGMFIGCQHNKPDIAQSNSNQIAKDSSREVVCSREEIEILLADHDSAILANLKPKQIIRYLKAKLTLSDSLRIANYFKPLPTIDGELSFDTTSDVRFFDEIKDCYIINGISYPDTTILSIKFESGITTVLYWKWKRDTFLKRLFHFDFSKINDCVSILNCNGDSLAIQNNIVVTRK